MQYYQRGIWLIPKFILQGDNKPKHTVRDMKNHVQWLEEQGVMQQMVLHPQSHEVNLWLHEETEDTKTA